jgi:acyl-coenzyme A thioesterase PaaI-like protein
MSDMAPNPADADAGFSLVVCDEDIAHCFGCGYANTHGFQIKSYWNGKEGICRFKPKPYHCGFDGVLYGGLIASLIDCHSMKIAVVATYEAENRPVNSRPGVLYMTANLNVDYFKPVPLESEVLLRAKVEEITPRKAVAVVDVEVDGQVHARGRVIGVRTISELDGENLRLDSSPKK